MHGLRLSRLPEPHVTWPLRPLSDTELREIDALGPRYAGWAIEPSGAICVDMMGADDQPVRFRGETLRKALKAAREGGR